MRPRIRAPRFGWQEWADDRHFGLGAVRGSYKSGMTETYLCACLIGAFEDIHKDRIVLYDTRLDAISSATDSGRTFHFPLGPREREQLYLSLIRRR